MAIGTRKSRNHPNTSVGASEWPRTPSPSKWSKAKNIFKGFTLVEMLIIAPIVILILGVFISTIINITGSVLSSGGANTLTGSIKTALSQIEQDMKISNGYLATNSVTPLSLGQDYNNSNTLPFKNADATSGTKLILNSYATVGNPLAASQTYVFLSGQPNACGTPEITRNTRLMFNLVYFVKTVNNVNSLWRRTIAPSNYTTAGCIGASTGAPWQKPSCVPGYIPASFPFCQANDIQLVDGITSFDIKYYTSAGTELTAASIAANSNSVRQADLLNAGSTNVTITATKSIAGRNVSKTGTVRAAITN